MKKVLTASVQIKAYYIQRTTVRPELKQWKLQDNVIKFLKCFKQITTKPINLESHTNSKYALEITIQVKQRKHDQ